MALKSKNFRIKNYSLSVISSILISLNLLVSPYIQTVFSQSSFSALVSRLDKNNLVSAEEWRYYDEDNNRTTAIRRSNYLAADTALIYSKNRDEIMFESNSDKKIAPASLAKLFVIDYIYSIFDDSELISVDTNILELVPEDSSVANIVPGNYYVSNLVAGMLVPSGNDAAYALCYAAAQKISGNSNIAPQEGLDLFIENLATYLKEQGYNDTIISNCSGFSYDDSSSCKDLLKVSKKLLENSYIRKVIQSPTYSSTNADGVRFEWVNTNRALQENSVFYDKRIKGFKTGSLNEIYNLISVLETADDEYILIELAAKDNIRRYYSNVYLMKQIGLDLSAEAAGVSLTPEEIEAERQAEEHDKLDALLPEIK